MCTSVSASRDSMVWHKLLGSCIGWPSSSSFFLRARWVWIRACIRTKACTDRSELSFDCLCNLWPLLLSITSWWSRMRLLKTERALLACPKKQQQFILAKYTQDLTWQNMGGGERKRECCKMHIYIYMCMHSYMHTWHTYIQTKRPCTYTYTYTYTSD